MPTIPLLPQPGGPKFDQDRRQELAAAFLSGGQTYDRIRPGYPEESVDWLVPSGTGALDVLDLGAGTGKLTGALLARGHRVVAVDPSEDMLAQLRLSLPTAQALLGTAEALPLADGQVDSVVVAQAWHWFDHQAASAEIARVLRPGGRLALIWNQLDVTVPWVHRLSRIMHAGDVHRTGVDPQVSPQFSPAEHQVVLWQQRLTPEEILELATSRSYFLRAGTRDRERVLTNLRWYLYEHLGHTVGENLELPYQALSWRMTLRPQR
ncbi:class I SAM-dependent methyltransferase [Psychromicrobium xiongbiense]|uniref:class I SAM-dependent methyltransferase n=1 Tax=Psychromicrobium xiongbiense TaxID=3051184 RepID=UPI002556D591|nr:class I SAM-dependent methyltransferase [Psychromicrobium sp. YIM S02556]